MVRGKWNYRFRYKDVYGDSRQKSVTAPTKEECYAKAEEFLEDLQKKIENPNIDVTIPDLLKYKFDTDHKMNYTGEVAYFRNLQFLKIWKGMGSRGSRFARSLRGSSRYSCSPSRYILTVSL